MNRSEHSNFLAAKNTDDTYSVLSLGHDGKPAGVVSQRTMTRKQAVTMANKHNRNYGFAPTS